jgi:hypothetical protein
MYSEGPLRQKPLEYLIHCAGCGCEVRIEPLELSGRLVICPQCGLANPTPIFRVLHSARGDEP